MTPAERLRAAADLIERTGANVGRDNQGGSWHTVPFGPITKVRASDDSHIADVVHWSDGAGPASAAWIALLGPDTAPTLAAWLRHTAEEWPVAGGMVGWSMPPALAFADLVLRGQS